MSRTLDRILRINFTHLGFKLLELKTEVHVVSGCVLCPCGGREWFAFRLPDSLDYKEVAVNILSRIASQKHLEEDVEKGLLPPFNVQKHCFTGELV